MFQSNSKKKSIFVFKTKRLLKVVSQKGEKQDHSTAIKP